MPMGPKGFSWLFGCGCGRVAGAYVYYLCIIPDNRMYHSKLESIYVFCNIIVCILQYLVLDVCYGHIFIPYHIYSIIYTMYLLYHIPICILPSSMPDVLYYVCITSYCMPCMYYTIIYTPCITALRRHIIGKGIYWTCSTRAH